MLHFTAIEEKLKSRKLEFLIRFNVKPKTVCMQYF